MCLKNFLQGNTSPLLKGFYLSQDEDVSNHSIMVRDSDLATLHAVSFFFRKYYAYNIGPWKNVNISVF